MGHAMRSLLHAAALLAVLGAGAAQTFAAAPGGPVEQGAQAAPDMLTLVTAFMDRNAGEKEPPALSKVFTEPEIADYLRSMDESPDKIAAVAALNVVEQRWAAAKREDSSAALELLVAFKHRKARLGQVALERLCARTGGSLKPEEAAELARALKEGVTGEGGDVTALILQIGAKDTVPNRAMIWSLAAHLVARNPTDRERSALAVVEALASLHETTRAEAILTRLADDPLITAVGRNAVLLRKATLQSDRDAHATALATCLELLSSGAKDEKTLLEISRVIERGAGQEASKGLARQVAWELTKCAPDSAATRNETIRGLVKERVGASDQRFETFSMKLLFAVPQEQADEKYWLDLFGAECASLIGQMRASKADRMAIAIAHQLVKRSLGEESARSRMAGMYGVCQLCSADSELGKAAREQFLTAAGEWLDEQFPGGKPWRSGTEGKKLDEAVRAEASGLESAKVAQLPTEGWKWAYRGEQASSDRDRAWVHYAMGRLADRAQADKASAYHTNLAKELGAGDHELLARVARLRMRGASVTDVFTAGKDNLIAGVDDPAYLSELAGVIEQGAGQESTRGLARQAAWELAKRFPQSEAGKNATVLQLVGEYTAALDTKFDVFSRKILLSTPQDWGSEQYWVEAFGAEYAPLIRQLRDAKKDPHALALAHQLVKRSLGEEDIRSQMAGMYGVYQLCGADSELGKTARGQFLAAAGEWLDKRFPEGKLWRSGNEEKKLGELVRAEAKGLESATAAQFPTEGWKWAYRGEQMSSDRDRAWVHYAMGRLAGQAQAEKVLAYHLGLAKELSAGDRELLICLARFQMKNASVADALAAGRENLIAGVDDPAYLSELAGVIEQGSVQEPTKGLARQVAWELAKKFPQSEAGKNAVVLQLAGEQTAALDARFEAFSGKILLSTPEDWSSEQYWAEAFGSECVPLVRQLRDAKKDPHALALAHRLIQQGLGDESVRVQMAGMYGVYRLCGADSELGKAAREQFLVVAGEWLDAKFPEGKPWRSVSEGKKLADSVRAEAKKLESATGTWPSAEGWKWTYRGEQALSDRDRAWVHYVLSLQAGQAQAFKAVAYQLGRAQELGLGDRDLLARVALLWLRKASLADGLAACRENLLAGVSNAEYLAESVRLIERGAGQKDTRGLARQTAWELIKRDPDSEQGRNETVRQLFTERVAELDKRFETFSRAILLATPLEQAGDKYWVDLFGTECAGLIAQAREAKKDARALGLAHQLVQRSLGEEDTRSQMAGMYAVCRLCGGESDLGQAARKVFIEKAGEWLLTREETLRANPEAVASNAHLESAIRPFAERLAKEPDVDLTGAWTWVWWGERTSAGVVQGWTHLALGRYAQANAAWKSAEYHLALTLRAQGLAPELRTAVALDLAQFKIGQGQADQEAASYLETALNSPLSGKSVEKAEEILLLVAPKIGNPCAYRLAGLLAKDNPAYRGTSEGMQAFVRQWQDWKRKRCEEITLVVFTQFPELVGKRLAWSSKELESVAGTELNALESKFVDDDGKQAAEALCRLCAPLDCPEDFRLKAAIGYATWLRFGKTPAGQAGREVFLKASEVIFAAQGKPGQSGLDEIWRCAYLVETKAGTDEALAARGRIGEWCAGHQGETVNAALWCLKQAAKAKDAGCAASILRSASRCMSAGDRKERAVPLLLAGADIAGVRTPLGREMTVEAVGLLCGGKEEAVGWDLARELVSVNELPATLVEGLKKYLERQKVESAALERSLSTSGDTEAGDDALRQTAYLKELSLGAAAVDAWYADTVSRMRDNRAGRVAALLQASWFLRTDRVEQARTLLNGMDKAKFTPDQKAWLSELLGDASGDLPGACEQYRKAAGAYILENELGGFEFFRLKQAPLPPGATKEEWGVEWGVLKGYLLLARGRRYEGMAQLQRALLASSALANPSDICRLRTVDANFLLGGALLRAGDAQLGALYGQRALQELASGDLFGGGQLAFAEALIDSLAPGKKSAATLSLDEANKEVQNALAAASSLTRQQRFPAARTAYEDILRRLRRKDPHVVYQVCNGVVNSFREEYRTGALEEALFHFRTWAARVLPPEYQGCVTLAIGRAYYVDKDNDKALAEVRDFLKANPDSKLAPNAKLLAGLVLLRAGRVDEAQATLGEVIALGVDDPELAAQAQFLMGYMALVAGRTAEARSQFEALVAKYPETSFAEKAKGVLSRLQK